MFLLMVFSFLIPRFISREIFRPFLFFQFDDFSDEQSGAENSKLLNSISIPFIRRKIAFPHWVHWVAYKFMILARSYGHSIQWIAQTGAALLLVYKYNRWLENGAIRLLRHSSTTFYARWMADSFSPFKHIEAKVKRLLIHSVFANSDKRGVSKSSL